MPVICVGPVCIPLNLFLPFLVGLLHKAGYLKWVKPEWFTVRHWSNRYSRWREGDKDGTTVAAPTSCSSARPGSCPVASCAGQSTSSNEKRKIQGSAHSLHNRGGHCQDNIEKGSEAAGE